MSPLPRWVYDPPPGAVLSVQEAKSIEDRFLAAQVGGRVTAFETKDSGARAQFANGGQRDTEDGKPRFDLCYPLNVPYGEQLLTRFAALMARGAAKYADRNWEQFSDDAALARAKSSAARHFVQWLSGERDEDHGAAVLFNIMAAEFVGGVLSGRWDPLNPEETA